MPLDMPGTKAAEETEKALARRNLMERLELGRLDRPLVPQAQTPITPIEQRAAQMEPEPIVQTETGFAAYRPVIDALSLTLRSTFGALGQAGGGTIGAFKHQDLPPPGTSLGSLNLSPGALSPPSQVRSLSPAEPLVNLWSGGDLGLENALTRQGLTYAARYTGLAIHEFSQTGNRNQLPNFMSTDVAAEIVGSERSREFMEMLGYMEFAPDRWERVDPITVSGIGSGYSSGRGRSRGGYRVSRGSGAYAGGGRLVSWRIGT